MLVVSGVNLYWETRETHRPSQRFTGCVQCFDKDQSRKYDTNIRPEKIFIDSVI